MYKYFLREVFNYIFEKKKFTLLPIILIFILFGALIVFTQGSVFAPFIYTLF